MLEKIKNTINNLPPFCKKLIMGAIGLVVVILFIFLFWGEGDGVAKNFPDKIVMGWNEWPGVVTCLVAHEKGYFAEEGLNVEIKKEGSYRELLKDVIEGKIDYAPDIVSVDVLMENEKGANLVIVGVNDFSNGADRIIVSSNINSISDFRGRKVAVAKGTISEFLLILALDTIGLKEKDVILLDLNVEESAEAFKRGEVSVAVTYEPFISPLLNNGYLAKKIFSSADVPGHILDAIVFRKDFVERYPDAVMAVLRAHFKAVDFIDDEKTKDEAMAIGAKYFGITPEKFGRGLEGLSLLDKKENLNVFSYANGPRSIYIISQAIHRFLSAYELVKKVYDPDDIISTQFVKTLGGGY